MPVSKQTIFLVDYNTQYATKIEQILVQENYEVCLLRGSRQLIDNLYKKPDLIILEHDLSDDPKNPYTGRYVMKKLATMKLNIPVIILSGINDVKMAVDLLKLNVIDYIVKDEDAPEKLLQSMENVFKLKHIKEDALNNTNNLNKTKKELIVAFLFVVLIIFIVYNI